MILAIDIGNTNIVVGCIDEQKTYFIERVSTDRSKKLPYILQKPYAPVPPAMPWATPQTDHNAKCTGYFQDVSERT